MAVPCVDFTNFTLLLLSTADYRGSHNITPEILELEIEKNKHFVLTNVQQAGAPNENIVQNHLNIALLNVFYYLNGRYRYIFIP